MYRLHQYLPCYLLFAEREKSFSAGSQAPIGKKDFLIWLTFIAAHGRDIEILEIFPCLFSFLLRSLPTEPALRVVQIAAIKLLR